jgi:hypothetical protein
MTAIEVSPLPPRRSLRQAGIIQTAMVALTAVETGSHFVGSG